MAKEHNVDRESMRRLFKEDLQLVPYKLEKEHHLKDQMQASKLEKRKKIKFLCRSDLLNRILFTEEKIFNVQPFRNSLIQRELLLKGSPRNLKVGKVFFPKPVMV